MTPVKLNQHDAKFGEVYQAKQNKDLFVMVIGRTLLGNLDVDYRCAILASGLERPALMNWALFKDQWERLDG